MSTTSLLLELDLTEAPLPAAPPDPLSWLQARRRPTLHFVLERLAEAATDPRVAGLLAKVGGTALTLAQAQELRAAVLDFRRAGKRAVAWAETFAEFGPGTAGYLLATGFEQIWLQPSGTVGLTGVAVEATFLRGTLDLLGVQPELAQRHEYKNAADLLLRREFSAAHRQAAARLAESAFDQVVEAVAEARGLDRDQVRRLADQAPVLAVEAQRAGLVDRLGYRDEVYAELAGQLGPGARLRYLARYQRARAARAARVVHRVRPTPRPAVALVTGTGTIHAGRSRRSPLAGLTMGLDTVTAALRSAACDPHVAAVVFRVDSRGGSYVASDAIWRAVGQVRQAGRPVVVSMGSVAGSGGYFVALPADAIVAQPGTLTGSIGVLAGKLVTTGLLDRLGVGHDAVAEGQRARMFSSRAPFSEDDWRRLDSWLDAVYADFVGKVAQARRLSPEQVHEIARGRVWTGSDAFERGLVDHLGGLSRAAGLARELAGLPAEAELRRWPPVSPRDWLSPAESSADRRAAAAGTGWSVAAAADAGSADAGFPGWGPFAAMAAWLGAPVEGPLTMPGLRLA